MFSTVMRPDKVWKSIVMFAVIVFNLHCVNTKPRATEKNSKDSFEE
jgi:hypothetical protein